MEQLAETPLGILPRSQAWKKLKEAGIDGNGNIKILETSPEIWGPNPEKPGYLLLVRRKRVQELWEEVKALLPFYVPEWADYFDYIGVSAASRLEDKDAVIPEYRWVSCYVVRGGSEGYYLHVDVINAEDQRTLLFLGKTLSGSSQMAWETAQAISLILED